MNIRVSANGLARYIPLKHPDQTRKLDVLHELAQGFSTKQIASVLNISEQTVKVHIRNLPSQPNASARASRRPFYFYKTRECSSAKVRCHATGPSGLISPGASRIPCFYHRPPGVTRRQ